MNLAINLAKILLCCAFFIPCCFAQPDSPVPSQVFHPKNLTSEPVPYRVWIERPSTLAVLQTMAVIADIKTTHYNTTHGGYEQNPLVRAVAGAHPSYGKMAAGGAVEIGLSYLLAKKFPKMRWLQVSFTVGHGACAAHNLAVR